MPAATAPDVRTHAHSDRGPLHPGISSSHAAGPRRRKPKMERRTRALLAVAARGWLPRVRSRRYSTAGECLCHAGLCQGHTAGPSPRRPARQKGPGPSSCAHAEARHYETVADRHAAAFSPTLQPRRPGLTASRASRGRVPWWGLIASGAAMAQWMEVPAQGSGDFVRFTRASAMPRGSRAASLAQVDGAGRARPAAGDWLKTLRAPPDGPRARGRPASEGHGKDREPLNFVSTLAVVYPVFPGAAGPRLRDPLARRCPARASDPGGGARTPGRSAKLGARTARRSADGGLSCRLDRLPTAEAAGRQSPAPARAAPRPRRRASATNGSSGS